MSWGQVLEDRALVECSSTRVVFFGDSICVGQGVSIHRGWVARLAAHLENFATQRGKAVVVVNASVNGNTTRQALERMPYDVQSHGVDLLLVQFGLNDCNYWLTDGGAPRVSLAGFRANLMEIIDRGRRFGARHVVINTNHPTTRHAKSIPECDVTYEESNRTYNASIRAVALDSGEHVTLVDVEREIQRVCANGDVILDELLLDDGLHLSERGHDIYFSLVAPVVESTLQEIFTNPSLARPN